MAEQLSYTDIAKMIDISCVQTPHGESEIRELIDCAKDYGFGCVHVLPAWIPFAKELLADATGIQLGAPTGFPSGGHHSRVKNEEALQLVKDGVDELDMMINVGKLRSGDDDYVLNEIKQVVDSVNVPVKVILETHYLTDDEIRRGCELCIKAGAAFVKTGTGWAPTGATIENITLITDTIQGRIGVKAAGGIRDLHTLIQMYKLGVRRFGVNMTASVEIIEECKQLDNGTVQVM